MEQMFEYKFVRLGEGFIWVRSVAKIKNVINEYAKNGWRLVQIFSPGLGQHRISKYYELIFEKEKQ